MPFDQPSHTARWHASLALAFERRAGRSVLARRAHEGPLVVQKPFYPEGDGVCHAIILHPPAGIAGGDDLRIAVHAAAGAHALLTTPGAAKWYRTAGAAARQRVTIDAAEESAVEWLPQESIVYDGAIAEIAWQANLARGARLIAWDIVCLGRTGSGERFERGRCAIETRIAREGVPILVEKGVLEAGGTACASAAGLAGASVFGTFVAACDAVGESSVAHSRELRPPSGEAAVTRLPGALVARYRGDSTLAAREYFAALWERLREPLMGRAPVEPRIWRT
jgi:urease accessory protein